jgi:HD-GYP domain-containing protein (c-di-GMP phosphodiesterase class II)
MGLETRILAVCDVYDALVSDRVYRPAWTMDRAFALLREEADAYGQDVVEALARTLGGAQAEPEVGWVAGFAERPAPRLTARAAPSVR